MECYCMDFFQAVTVSILLYECTTDETEKASGETTQGCCVDQNQETIPYITATVRPFTIYIGQTKLAGHCWKSKDEFRSNILWTPTHGHTSVG